MNINQQSRPWPADRGLRLPARTSVIGVDITDRYIGIAQLGGVRSGPASLRGGLVIERREPGQLKPGEAADLAQTLRRAGFEGREVVVAAPDEGLMTAHLELPPHSSSAPLDEIARAEMARLYRTEAGSFAMGYWDLPTVDRAKGGPTAMAVGLQEETSASMVRSLRDAGLEVVGIDARMCAISRASAAAIGTVSGLVGVFELGWNQARVLLLHCNGREWTLVYERRITEAGLRTMVESVANRLGVDLASAMHVLRGAGIEDGAGMSPDMTTLMRTVRQMQSDYFEVLVPEVQRSIAYASQRYSSMPLCGGYICGEGALTRGLRGKLAQELSLECAPILPSDVVQVDGASTMGGACELVCAIGLAAFSPLAAAKRERIAA